MGAGTAGRASCLPLLAIPMAQGLEEALTLLSLPASELLWTGLSFHTLLLFCWHLCLASADVLSRKLVSCTCWHVFFIEAISLMGTVAVFVEMRLAGVWKYAFLRQ